MSIGAANTLAGMVNIIYLFGSIAVGFRLNKVIKRELVLTIASTVVPAPAKAGIAMALLAMMQNIGAMIGPAVIGSFFEDKAALATVSRWEDTIPFMLAAASLGIIFVFFSRNSRIRDAVMRMD